MQIVDYGIDKALGLSAMVEYAREQKGQSFERYLQKVRGMSFKQFINSNDGLTNASNYGFSPVDCVRERVGWTALRKRFSVKDLVQFGMTFDIAVKVGLQPQHLGGDKGHAVLEQMGATSEQVKEFLFNFDALKTSKLSPETLKKIGFSFEDLLQSKCDATNMQQLHNFDIKSIVLAFQPTAEEWVEAKFTDEHIQQYKWDASLYRRFIAPETSKLNATNLNVSGSVPTTSSSRSAQLSLLERRERGAGLKNMNMARPVQPPEPEAMEKQFIKVLDTKKLLNFKLNIN